MKNTSNEDNSVSSEEGSKKLALQQLLAKMQGEKPKVTKWREYCTKVLAFIIAKLSAMVYYIDRFINFVTKSSDPARDEVVQVARGPVLFGTYVAVIFVVFGGGWVTFAPLDSAAPATGTVITSSKKKIINHQEGGIIKEVYIKQGDIVKDGQPLLALDDIRAKAAFETHLNRYRNSLATESRLIAERDSLADVEFPQFLLDSKDLPEVVKLMQTQDNLFKSRRDALNSLVNGLNQRIEQAKKQIEGSEARQVGQKKTLEVLQERIKATRDLLAKGFVQKAALSELESKEANLKGEIGNLVAEISRIRQEIVKDEMEIAMRKSDNLSNVLKELRETQAALSESYQSYYSAKDALDRTIVRSPSDGIVNELHLYTKGVYLQPNQPIAEITPINDQLVLDVRIPRKNINAVQVGLKAKIRFGAFKSRTTPTFDGVVVSLSPDIIVDPKAAQGFESQMMSGDNNYYSAKIELDMKEFNEAAEKLHLKLLPGMQADVQIVTGERTMLRYLMDPFVDNMFRAMSEK